MLVKGKGRVVFVGILLAMLLLGAILPTFVAPQPVYASIETLRPNAAGSETSITSQEPAATSHYDKVDEASADDDSTYVYTSTATYQRDLYSLPAHSGTGNINSITVYFRCEKTNAVRIGFVKPSIKSDSTTTDGTEVAVSTSWATYSQTWATNPVDDESWEWSDIDDLQIGISLRSEVAPGTETRCTQVYVIVDYTFLSAPTITINAASNIAMTTAKLNSTVVDDGGEACEVRWGYGETSESAIEDYDHFTSFAGSYTTDDKPYYDVDSLSLDTLYYFCVEIQNSEDTELGGELSFTTTSGVSDPTEFRAYPSATSNSLTWVKGAGTSNSVVRYRTDTFPATYTDGFLVYEGSSSSTTHDDLLPGRTYYYAVWGYSGATYSSGSAEVMVTTLAGVAGGEDIPTPGTPTGWLAAPDYTAMEDLPFEIYDAVNGVLDSLDIPRASGWMAGALVLSMGIAFLIYTATHGSFLGALLMLLVVLAFFWRAGLIPMWMPILNLIGLLALFIVKKREAF